MTPTGKSVEEMAREIVDAGMCRWTRTFCHHHTAPPDKVCIVCWLIHSTPAQIRTKYAEMIAEKGGCKAQEPYIKQETE